MYQETRVCYPSAGDQPGQQLCRDCCPEPASSRIYETLHEGSGAMTRKAYFCSDPSCIPPETASGTGVVTADGSTAIYPAYLCTDHACLTANTSCMQAQSDAVYFCSDASCLEASSSEGGHASMPLLAALPGSMALPVRCRQLQCHAWYHGPITRISAELSMACDGDFLVRDCISAPGEFVLTCRWRGQPMHFRMNRIVDGEVGVKYLFESEAFGSVPELILFHLNHQVAISSLSGARIRNPIGRDGGDLNYDHLHHDLHDLSVSSPVWRPAPAPPPPPAMLRRFQSLPGSVRKAKPLPETLLDDENRSLYEESVALRRDADRASVTATLRNGLRRSRHTRSMILETVSRGGTSAFASVSARSKSASRSISDIRALIGSSPRLTHKAGGKDGAKNTKGFFSNLFSSGKKQLQQQQQPQSAKQENPPRNLEERPHRSRPPRGGGLNGHPPAFASPPPPPAPPVVPCAPAAAKQFHPLEFPKDIHLPVPGNALADAEGGGVAAGDNSQAPVAPPTGSSPSSSDTASTSNKSGLDGGGASPTYDVPRKPRSCLSDRQLQFNPLYDQPRVLRRARILPGAPRMSAQVRPNAHPLYIVRSGQSRLGDGDTSSMTSIETNTDSTSYLEHRELTPLLSSEDNDSLVLDASEPFPAGLSEFPPPPQLPLPSPPPPPPPPPSEHQSSSRLGPQGDPRGSADGAEEDGHSEAEDEEGSSANGGTLRRRSDANKADANTYQSIEDLPGMVTSTKLPSDSPSPAQSLFTPQYFRSSLFKEAYNKPLDPTAMRAVHGLLLELPARTLAMHVTRLDHALLAIRMVEDAPYPGLPDVRSGLHLVTLVDGKGLRADVVERCLCLRLFVIVSIFTSANWDQSVSILAKWIQVADELRSTFGNFYSFFAVVSALSHCQLQTLPKLWTALQRACPDLVLRLDSRLKPLMKALNEVRTPMPTNTTVPHIVPFLVGCKDLKDRATFRMLFNEIYGSSRAQPKRDEDDTEEELVPVETESLPLFQAHMARMQTFLDEIPTFKENADLLFANVSDSNLDGDLAADMFRTEFHLRLLWGSNGATSDSEERHAKFDKVVTAMATICKNIEKTIF